jgi:phage terminase large subunit-like protein
MTPDTTSERIPLGSALVSNSEFSRYAKQPDWRERLARATYEELYEAVWGWRDKARADQLPPAGDWTTWLMLGGRGAGKTRAGAEWVKGMALGLPHCAAAPVERIALVGETLADVRDVMVEGISGILRRHTRRNRPTWTVSKRQLEWSNGAKAQAFSSEDPESLRGPQIPPPGATSWPNGNTRTRPGICCNSGCGSAKNRGRW